MDLYQESEELEQVMADKFRIEKRLKKQIKTAMDRNDIDMALKLAACCAQMVYMANQVYVDEQLEELTAELAATVSVEKDYIPEDKCILFYDCFGDDTRGLALIYLRALVQSGYKVVYLTLQEVEGKIPTIQKVLAQADNAEIVYFQYELNKETITQLNKQFQQYKPSVAFFYSKPQDLIGAAVFRRYEKLVKRFQINLTDHAFWVGRYSFDYCIEFRDYGASISHYKRKLEQSRIIKLPYYPVIDQTVEFQGYPFAIEDVDKVKLIFSGGSLYKTMDAADTYYNIVDAILQKHSDVVFWYAGYGDGSRLLKLQEKYKERVVWTKERKDLFQVMCKCRLYLNTYPVVGGLMMQYAAVAGKLPMTLRGSDIGEGILEHQKELGIEFISKEQLLEDIDRLLQDDAYLQMKSKGIEKTVISEQEFTNELLTILEQDSNHCEIEYRDIDTKQFQQLYLDNFNRDTVEEIISQKKYSVLFWRFPLVYVSGAIKKIRTKIKTSHK